MHLGNIKTLPHNECEEANNSIRSWISLTAGEVVSSISSYIVGGANEKDIMTASVGNDLLAKNRPGDKDILAGKRENATAPEPQDSYACVVMRGRVKK